MKRSIVEAGQGGPGSAVARQEASLDSHAPLLLPRHVERKLEERASALKRPGLSSRLARAEALRTSVLEERSKRARSLSFDNVERARQRRTRAKIKQCFEEAARTARELLASKRRTSELRGLRERVATKNARVDSVRDAMRARATKERTVRVLALESRLELAAQRRRALSRSPRGAGASQGHLPAFGPSPDAVPLPDPLDPHLAARLIQRRWRRARAERAIRVLASHLPRWFVRRARQAARGRGNPSLVDPGFEVVEGVEVDRDYLLFRAFDRSSQVVQNPAVIRAARGLLDKLPGGEPGGGRHARPLLASFVIVLHPEVVMSRKGNAVEDLLRERAAALVACLAHLIQASGGDFGSFPQKLSSYAAAFVSWKKGDAAALEGDLIKMAHARVQQGPPPIARLLEPGAQHIRHKLSLSGEPHVDIAISKLSRPRRSRLQRGGPAHCRGLHLVGQDLAQELAPALARALASARGHRRCPAGPGPEPLGPPLFRGLEPSGELVQLELPALPQPLGAEAPVAELGGAPGPRDELRGPPLVGPGVPPLALLADRRLFSPGEPGP